MKRVLVGLLCVLWLSGCSGAENTTTDGLTPDQTTTTAPPVQVDFEKTEEDMFTDRDKEETYDDKQSVAINLTGTTASVGHKSVAVNGSTVTITAEGTYILNGSLSDGSIVVEAPETAKVQLVLNGVSVNSTAAAALYIKTADKVFVTLNGENTLENGGSFTGTDTGVDGTVFSRQDLTLNGTGSLTVNSPAGHGIVGKDDVVITGGTYTVTASGHAIDANDSVRVTGDTTVLTLDAGKDGIHVENSDDATKGYVYISAGKLTVESEGDGLSAGAYMQIEGGDISVLAGGGYENGTKESSDNWGGFGGGGFGGGGRPGRREAAPMAMTAAPTDTTDTSTSMKGLKAETGLLIADGVVTVDSADDGIHSNGSVTVNGGTISVASGDDGIHAEDTLTVTAGKIAVSTSYEGLEALHIAIQGGDISLVASDDGINAAGGTDSSGTGGRDQMFGGGNPGGMGGNANGSIVISGGTVSIQASGDGIDANGTLEITGGHTTVVGPTQGDTAVLDYDKTGTITGGTFIGTGSSMMAQSLDSTAQGVLAISVGNQSSGTTIQVLDSSGKTVLNHTPTLPYQVFIFSSPELRSGETYTIKVGTQTGEITAQ